VRALKAQQAKDRLRLGNDWTNSGLVFAAEHGGPRWPQDVRKQFGRLCERAGLGAGWHPHETRHTWVSLLSDAGVDLEDIADGAGHITSAVTRNVYRHQLGDRLTKASAAMDAAFSPAEVSGQSGGLAALFGSRRHRVVPLTCPDGGFRYPMCG
jgi:integrase